MLLCWPAAYINMACSARAAKCGVVVLPATADERKRVVAVGECAPSLLGVSEHNAPPS